MVFVYLVDIVDLDFDIYFGVMMVIVMLVMCCNLVVVDQLLIFDGDELEMLFVILNGQLVDYMLSLMYLIIVSVFE